MLKLLSLILILIQQCLSKRSHPFQANFKDSKGTKIGFFVDFANSVVLISNKLINCDQANACQFIDDHYEKQSYNNTDIMIRQAKITLFTTKNQPLDFIVYFNDNDFNVLGVLPDAFFAQSLQDNFLKVDFINGDTELKNSLPEPLLTLKTDNKASPFYLPLKFEATNEFWQQQLPDVFSKVNSKIKAHFQTFENFYNGDFFFMMCERDLEGWNEFLNKYRILSFEKFKYTLSISGTQIEFDNELFPAYDSLPFKKIPNDEELIKDYIIGKFFVQKTMLELFLSYNQATKLMEAGVLIHDRAASKGFLVYFRQLITAVINVGIFAAFVLWIVHCCRGKNKRQLITDDKYVVV